MNKTLSMVNLDETLVIVTADHGHTMSIAGYQVHGLFCLSFDRKLESLSGSTSKLLPFFRLVEPTLEEQLITKTAMMASRT